MKKKHQLGYAFIISSLMLAAGCSEMESKTPTGTNEGPLKTDNASRMLNNDYTLVEGDILMPNDQEYESDQTLKRVIAPSIMSWPTMTVYACFVNTKLTYEENGTTRSLTTIPWSELSKKYVELAIKTWNATQRVNIVVRQSCALYGNVFLYNFDGIQAKNEGFSGNSFASIGWNPSKQLYAAFSNASDIDWNYSLLQDAIHELGHVIGYSHEQQSPNRNPYITVTGSNPDNQQLINANASSFDWGSVMIYNVDPPSTPGAEITAKQNWINLNWVGRIGLISTNDKLGLSAFSTNYSWTTNAIVQNWKLKNILSSKYLSYSGTSLAMSPSEKIWSYIAPIANISGVNGILNINAVGGSFYPYDLSSSKERYLLQNELTLGVATSKSYSWMIDYINVHEGADAFVLRNVKDDSAICNDQNGGLYISYPQVFQYTEFKYNTGCYWQLY